MAPKRRKSKSTPAVDADSGGISDDFDAFFIDADSASGDSSIDPDGLGHSSDNSDTSEDADDGEVSVKTALKTEPGKQCTIVAKVLNKSRRHKYITTEGQMAEYCILYIADNDTSATIRMYKCCDDCKFPKIDKEEAYKFKSLTRQDEMKRNESFIAPYHIKVKELMGIHVGRKVRKISRRLQYTPLWNSTRRRTLNDAFYSEEESTVTGKIVKVSPMKKILSDDYEEIDMIHLALIDESGMDPLKVTVFGDNATKEYEEGLVVILSNVCLRQLKVGQIPGLCSRKITKSAKINEVQIVNDDESRALKKMSTNIPVIDPDFAENVFIIKEVIGVIRTCNRIVKDGIRCTGHIKCTNGRFWCETCVLGRKPNERVLDAFIRVHSQESILTLRNSGINDVIGAYVLDDDEIGVEVQLQAKLPCMVKGHILNVRGEDILNIDCVITNQ